MKPERNRLIALVGALFLIASPLLAGDLDARTVDNWAASMEELEAWGDSQNDLDDDYAGADDPQDFQSALSRMVQQDREIQRIIERHGFADGAEWAEVGSRIFQAYLAVQMREQEPEMQREFQEQMEAIDSNPHLSEEQKQEMRSQMEQMMGMMSGMFTAPEADMAAVQERRSRLDELFGN